MKRGIDKARALILITTMVIGFVGLTGCKDSNKDTEQQTVDNYKTLELSEIAKHRDRGSIKVVDSAVDGGVENNNDTLENDFDPNAIIEQPGNESYVTKFGYSELKLENKDTTEYFEISGDDIIYGGVTYMGLNKALDSIEYPYDKTTLINFIVKTYDPMDTTVEVTFSVADADGYVEGWSVDLSDSLLDAWDGYQSLIDGYGKPVNWTITIADYETFDRQSYLYGCSDYMVYLSYTVGETIDMSNFEEIRP